MKMGKNGKPRYINGSEEHRRFILERTVAQVKETKSHEENEWYKVAGRSPKAMLCNICEDYKVVKWDGLKVLCMEVFLPDEQEFELFHPSDLTKPRKR
jgi:hypothetical protein